VDSLIAEIHVILRLPRLFQSGRLSDSESTAVVPRMGQILSGYLPVSGDETEAKDTRIKGRRRTDLILACLGVHLANVVMFLAVGTWCNGNIKHGTANPLGN
jgi:hypothetical protein